MSGLITPGYSCYHVFSKVLDKNACRSIDSDLTVRFWNQFHNALLLYEVCNKITAEQLSF